MNFRQADIILVEDLAHEAEMTKRALQKNGISNHVVHFENGEEMLSFLQGKTNNAAIHQKPKLILLDLKLPGMSGLDVLKNIKANNATKTIPVVILSSSKEETDVKQCLESGANSYIVKPIQYDDFLKAVKDAGLYWTLHNQSL